MSVVVDCQAKVTLSVACCFCGAEYCRRRRPKIRWPEHLPSSQTSSAFALTMSAGPGFDFNATFMQARFVAGKRVRLSSKRSYRTFSGEERADEQN